MKAKLIKKDVNYILEDDKEVERGYDLEEYIAFEVQAYIAENHNHYECIGFMDGYEKGFQKCLELLDSEGCLILKRKSE